VEDEGLDIVKGSAPSEMEKEIACGVRAGSVGALGNISWSVVTAEKTERCEDETNHSPQKKKWRYACRLFGMNSIKVEATYCIDQSLCNNSVKISCSNEYTTIEELLGNGCVFCVVQPEAI
jgi:hypothetical protein